MMKTIRCRAAEGLQLSHVYLCSEQWRKLTTTTIVPDSQHLMNFDLETSDGAWLILDPYGDEVMANWMYPRFFAPKSHSCGIPLAINKETGVLLTVQFGTETSIAKEKAGYYISLAELESHGTALRVPKKYLKRLDTLKNKKRPFYFTSRENTLWGFTEQEASKGDLMVDIVVDLQFEPYRVQISHDMHRLVSDWRN